MSLFGLPAHLYAHMCPFLFAPHRVVSQAAVVASVCRTSLQLVRNSVIWTEMDCNLVYNHYTTEVLQCLGRIFVLARQIYVRASQVPVALNWSRPFAQHWKMMRPYDNSNIVGLSHELRYAMSACPVPWRFEFTLAWRGALKTLRVGLTSVHQPCEYVVPTFCLLRQHCTSLSQ